MDIIKLLSDNIANQIAAGEVVQRPASVVKELLENSIDAGAEQITLIIKEAGKSLIQVIDTGKGMSITDARMSFERHATSKISSSEDLFKIKTMGFRGEALASIAAVAQVEMKSRLATEELGTQIHIEGSLFKSQEPISTPVGTSISVKNLFFNVPARRNFLKSNPVEMKHILEEFIKVALANPAVSFDVYHNDTEIYRLPKEKLSKRITDLFGKSYKEQLAVCRESTPLVQIDGYIGKPSAAKKSRGEQYFFVNNRFIKSSYLNHAVTSAFEATIEKGAYPFYVLNIHIDPSLIDINIHPTKTEIKFEDEKAVYAILRSAVRQAIGVYNLTPSIDFESDINFSRLSQPLSRSTPKIERSIESFEKRPPANWKDLYEGIETKVVVAPSKANALVDSENSFTKAFQLHQKYLMLQVKSGLLLIDQKAAYERIFYERFLKSFSQGQGQSQQLLFQKSVELTGVDFGLVKELWEDLTTLGFSLEEFGKNALLITGVPVVLLEEDPEMALKELIQEYKLLENDVKISRKEGISKTMAKRAATHASKKLRVEDAKAFIDQLFACSVPGLSPDGKNCTRILPMEELSELIQSPISL